jgi:hypothetical protein
MNVLLLIFVLGVMSIALTIWIAALVDWLWRKAHD